MKTLLYATDYSDNSIPAFHYAQMLSESLQARLYVLHVFDMKATFISTVSLTYARREEVVLREQAEKLEVFCSQHRGSKGATDSLTLLVHENSIPSVGILEKAESLNAELIVIGTKGSNLLQDLIMGSTASTLISESYIPVLAVPSVASVSTIEKIVYATAFEEADILAVRKLVALARPSDAEIKLVHITQKKEYAGEDQMAWFREMLENKVDYPNMAFELLFSEDISGTLLDYVRKEEGDLIVMLERENPNFLQRLWHQDTVKKVKMQLERPLLSFHKKNLTRD
jgi:nucleotide-binding universal stress UspA family protein